MQLPAAKADEQSAYANVNQKNWLCGGLINYTHNSSDTSTTDQLRLTVEARYFVIDRLAIGLDSQVTIKTDVDTVASLGPSATYFFWSQEKLATFVTAAFKIGLTDATVKSIFTGEVGLDYFITPSVAFGPDAFFDAYQGHLSNRSDLGLEFNFKIFI